MKYSKSTEARTFACDSLPYLIMKSYTRLLTGLSLVNHLGGYLSLQKRQRNDYLSHLVRKPTKRQKIRFWDFSIEMFSFGQVTSCWKQNQKIFWNDRVMAVWSHAIHRASTHRPNFDPAYHNIVAAGVRSVFSRSGSFVQVLTERLLTFLDRNPACVASPTQTMPTKYFFPSHIAHSLKTWMTESLHQQLLPSRSSLLAKCLKSHNQVEQRRRSNLPCSRAVQLTQTPWRWKTAVRFAATSAPPSAASLTGIVRASHKPCTRWKSEKNSTSVGDCTPRWRKTISRDGVRCTRNEMPTVGATSTRRCLKGTY